MISRRIRIRETGAVKCPSCPNTKVFRVVAEEADENEWKYLARCDVCGTSWETGVTETAFFPHLQDGNLIDLLKASMENNEDSTEL